MLRDGKGIRRGPTTVDILLAGITRVREILPTDSTTGKCRKAICRWVKKKKKKKEKRKKTNSATRAQKRSSRNLEDLPDSDASIYSLSGRSFRACTKVELRAAREDRKIIFGRRAAADRRLVAQLARCDEKTAAARINVVERGERTAAPLKIPRW